MGARTIDDLPGPRGLPLLGNALQLRPTSAHLAAERWCRRHGPMFKFRLGPRTIVCVGDGPAVNEALRRRPDAFRRWSAGAAIGEELGFPGVFWAEGDDWRRQRRLAVTALNVAHLHRYYDVVRVAAERLHRRLSGHAATGLPFAIEDELKAFTVDVTTALAFGRPLAVDDPDGDDLRPDIDRVFDALGRRLSAPVPYWRYGIKLPADRALERSLERLKAAVAGFVDEARVRMRERPELHDAPENFLEGMLAAQAREGRYSEDELFGNTLTMLLAGEDTTAGSLAWTSWFLALRPDVQARVAAEATALLGGDAVPGDHHVADGMAYGEAVLREVLRVKPVASLILSEPVEDVELAGVLLPAGTQLLLLTRHVAVQPASFAAPDVFDPDRWLDGTRDPKGFLPFGAGPRFCPGRNLAFLESKAALATLAAGFEVSIDPAAGPVRERFAFTTSPAGLRVRLAARVRQPAVLA